MRREQTGAGGTYMICVVAFHCIRLPTFGAHSKEINT